MMQWKWRIAAPLLVILTSAPHTIAQETVNAPEEAPQTAVTEPVRYGIVRVTANKREQSADDIGATISVYDGDDLENLGIETPEDLESLTAGLTVSASLPNGVPVFTIRGVGFSDFSTAGSSTVGLYVDGVNLPYPVMGRGLLLDVDRVEVLKGPQGDLYGRNTTGGQINFISHAPSREFEMTTSASIGSFGTYDIESAFSGPLLDNVQARVSGKYVLSDSGWQSRWTRNNGRSDEILGRQGDGAVRGLINIDATEDISILLAAHYFASNSDNIAPNPYGISPYYERVQLLQPGRGTNPQLEIDVADRGTAAWSIKPSRNNDMYGFSAVLDWALTDSIDLVSVTAYNDFRRDEDFDISGVSFEDGAYTDKTGIGSASQEVRLHADAGGAVNGIVGAYYSWDHIDNDTVIRSNESVAQATINSRYAQTTQSVAIFARGEWQAHRDLRLSFGGRFAHETRDWTGCSYENAEGGLFSLWSNISLLYLAIPENLETLREHAPAVHDAVRSGLLSTPIPAGACAVLDDDPDSASAGEFIPFSDTIQANRFMWRVTLDYTPTDSSMLYLTIAEGFKSGGYNGSVGLLRSQLQPYLPETLYAYELGAKSAWFGGAFRFNTAAFYYDYYNKQESTIAVTPAGNLGALTNVPRSFIIGVEWNVNWYLTQNFNMGVNAIYLYTEIIEYDLICQTRDQFGCERGSGFPNVRTVDGSGLKLPNSPEFQATFTAQYVQPIPFDMDLSMGGDIAYKDDNYGAIQPFLPAYTLLNFRVGLAPQNERWSLTVWADNVFDSTYWVAASQSPCCLTRTYGEPTTYGVTAQVVF